MEFVFLAIVFFSIVGTAGYFFGDKGAQVAMGCLIVGSILAIASLPVVCYIVLRFLVPML